MLNPAAASPCEGHHSHRCIVMHLSQDGCVDHSTRRGEGSILATLQQKQVMGRVRDCLQHSWVCQNMQSGSTSTLDKRMRCHSVDALDNVHDIRLGSV
jgi:hypothetical protein